MPGVSVSQCVFQVGGRATPFMVLSQSYLTGLDKFSGRWAAECLYSWQPRALWQLGTDHHSHLQCEPGQRGTPARGLPGARTPGGRKVGGHVLLGKSCPLDGKRMWVHGGLRPAMRRSWGSLLPLHVWSFLGKWSQPEDSSSPRWHPQSFLHTPDLMDPVSREPHRQEIDAHREDRWGKKTWEGGVAFLCQQKLSCMTFWGPFQFSTTRLVKRRHKYSEAFCKLIPFGLDVLGGDGGEKPPPLVGWEVQDPAFGLQLFHCDTPRSGALCTYPVWLMQISFLSLQYISFIGFRKFLAVSSSNIASAPFCLYSPSGP